MNTKSLLYIYKDRQRLGEDRKAINYMYTQAHTNTGVHIYKQRNTGSRSHKYTHNTTTKRKQKLIQGLSTGIYRTLNYILL